MTTQLPFALLTMLGALALTSMQGCVVASITKHRVSAALVERWLLEKTPERDGGFELKTA
jgi:hypothetical protein